MTWNGEPVALEETDIGSLRGSVTLPDALSDVTVPLLSDVDWVCADSLPELALDFDDSDWVVADKTSTGRPQKPFAGKVCVLYLSSSACLDVWFFRQNVLYAGE